MFGDNSAFREEEEEEEEAQRCPHRRFSGRLCGISRGDRNGPPPRSNRSGERRAGKPRLVLSLVGALRLGLRRAAGRSCRARLRPVAKREASPGRGGRWEGFCEGRWRRCSAKAPTVSRTDELDGEAPRSGDMSLDLEDSEDDLQASTSSLYKSKNPTIQEEKALLEELGANQYAFGKPKDHWNATYIIFFLLGTNSLLPLNFIITAKHYWIYKLQNCSEDISPEEQGSSDIRNFFESYISVASTVPSVLSLIGNFLLVNKVSVNVRILSSLAVMLAVFLVITVLVKVDTSAWTLWFFIVTIVCVAVISSAATIFISSLFGLSGSFPMRNSQALISGQAMGGTVSALASVVDLAASSEVTNSALAYFLIGDIFIVLCIVMYLILPKLEYARYYTATLSPNALPGSYLEEEDMAADNPSQLLSNRNYTDKIPPLGLILKKIGMLGFCVFYVYFISITIFPAVSSSIESVNKFSGSPWTDKYFTPLTSFLLYNFADWCGRQVTAWVQVPGPRSKWLPIMILLRTLFIPIFMLCNFQPRVHIANVLFAHDVYPMVFIVSLGLSNGYLSTLSIIYGPKITPKELSEAAGVLMMLFMQVGLALGSGFSVLIVHLI